MWIFKLINYLGVVNVFGLCLVIRHFLIKRKITKNFGTHLRLDSMRADTLEDVKPNFGSDK